MKNEESYLYFKIVESNSANGDFIRYVTYGKANLNVFKKVRISGSRKWTKQYETFIAKFAYLESDKYLYDQITTFTPSQNVYYNLTETHIEDINNGLCKHGFMLLAPAVAAFVTESEFNSVWDACDLYVKKEKNLRDNSKSSLAPFMIFSK